MKWKRLSSIQLYLRRKMAKAKASTEGQVVEI